MERRATLADIVSLHQVLIDQFIASQAVAPEELQATIAGEIETLRR